TARPHRQPTGGGESNKIGPFSALGLIPLGCPPIRWAVLWLTPTAVLGSLWSVPARPTPRRESVGRRIGAKPRDVGAMKAQELLQQIAEYCRHTGLAESTFGRRAVNDGKLTARLRN